MRKQFEKVYVQPLTAKSASWNDDTLFTFVSQSSKLSKFYPHYIISRLVLRWLKISQMRQFRMCICQTNTVAGWERRDNTWYCDYAQYRNIPSLSVKNVFNHWSYTEFHLNTYCYVCPHVRVFKTFAKWSYTCSNLVNHNEKDVNLALLFKQPYWLQELADCLHLEVVIKLSKISPNYFEEVTFVFNW